MSDKKKIVNVSYTTGGVITNTIFRVVIMVWWFSGIAVAVGGMKWVAAIFPPYALYKVIEKVLQSQGVI